MSRLVDGLRPGMRVFVPTLSTESSVFIDELRANPERARGVTFVGVQFPGIDRADYLTLHHEARQQAFFMTPAIRAGLTEGRAELLSLDYIGIARHLAEGPPLDLAVAHLTTPDAEGWCSPGLASDFMPLAWRRARRRVAHLNPRMPHTQGTFRVHVSELDAFTEADAPLNFFTEAPVGDVEKRIGEHVALLVRDGDTLQFGIGSVPLALAGALGGCRNLRFHGGLVSNGLRTFWEAGTLDRDAPIITGVALGDSAFHEFIAQLPTLRMADVTYTHDPARLATIPRFIAINTAAEVDLFGQINGERVGGAIQAGAGGLPAFAQGALASPGGRLLVCLGATARKGSISRIVPVIGAQSLCTLPRYLADAVVTEHGVAQLRHLSLDARAEALIGIAAPEHRAALLDAWRTLRNAA